MIYKGSSGLKAYVGSTGVDKMYKGDVLVYGGGEVVKEMPLYVALPTGGYILTGLYPTKSYKVVAKFFVLIKTSNWGALWGCNQSDDHNEFCIQYNSTNTTVRRNINTSHYSGGSILLFDYYTVEFTSTYHTINGTKYTGAYTGAELASIGNFTIGGRSTGAGAVRSVLSTAWVRMSIYDGETLLRDYIPWRDDSDNLCMKDTVNDTLVYSGSATKPLEYTEYTHIDRTNVKWRSGNIDVNGRITTYANQITSFIVLPRKGCSLQCTGDSTYHIGIRQYDKDFNCLNIGTVVAKGASVTRTLDSNCRIIRLVLWDKPSSSYVTDTADFEFDVV